MTSSNSGFGRRQCVRARCRVGFTTGVVTRAAIVSLCVACSGAGNEGGAPGAGAPNVDGPLYALGVRFVTADTTVGYIVTVPSLEAGATWNLDRAIEVGQDAWLSGSEGAGEVILVSSRDPSVSRWR